MNQRLPKSLRICQQPEIQKILAAGHKYIGNHIILYCLVSTIPETPIRAGFLSPKRLGKAVQRNRLRRQMRELFRQYRAKMSGSQQILIMGRTSAIDATYQTLHHDFLELCRKARLLPPCDL